MKKLLALLLACLLICPAALADVDYLLEDSGLTLTVPDAMTEQEPEEDDDEDLLLACVNEDETLLMLIFCTEAEGLTLDDVQEILSEDGTVSLYGVTIINGVETVYALGEEDGSAYVAYFHVSGAALTQFMFWYMDEEAANLSGEIMATLRTE